MISDRQTDILVERIINKINKANEYMLKQMGETIKKIGKLSPAEAQKLVNILKSGGDFYDIITQLTEYTGLSANEIDEIFIEYAKKDYLFYKQFYRYRNKPFVAFAENATLLRQTVGLSETYKREMYNYLRPNVLGYSIRNAQGQIEFLGLRETYNRVLDEALTNVSQGQQTFDSAMSQIMEDIGGSGLKTLDYASGRSYRIDSMARMHLTEGLKTLHNENQKIIGEQFDYNGIEVTHHANAAPDHIDTKDGKQFALVDRIREQIMMGTESQIKAEDIRGNQVWVEGKMYDDFNAVNDSLERPVSTLNCKHKEFPIILGVSKPEYTEEQLEEDKKKNLDGCIIDGKHYTLYEATQLQRQLERRIRQQKDIQIMAKAGDNNELILKSQSKITQLTNKYKQVSDISGLPTYKERTKVAGYKRTKVK